MTANANKTLVSASILAADFACLGDEIRRVEMAGSDWLHFDVMDGCFVPNISFGEVVLESVKSLVTVPLDVHLMITDPVRYVGDFAAAGASVITVHYEAAQDIRPALERIRELGCKAGISVKPNTPVGVIEPYLDIVDLILIMTVEPGFGGQAFIENSPEKIAAARALAEGFGRNIHVEVDGGINGETAHIVREAGADVLVSGSYLFKAADPAAAIASLKH